MNNCTRVLRALVCSLVMIFAGAAGAFSQQIENGITLSNGDYLGFLEYKPVDYDASGKTKYPIIVFLHGIGERGNGTTQLKNVACCGLPRIIKLGHPMTFTWNGKTETFLVLSPQSPPKYGMWQSFYIHELIDYAKQNLQIDTNRIYLTGLSMGGGGTYRYISTAAHQPKNIAAAATICAPCVFSNGKFAADAKLPVWSFHAADDYVAPANCTETAIGKINDHNPEVKPLMDIWPSGGHGVWDRVYTDTNYKFQGIVNIYEWFLGQDKSLPVNKLPIARAGNTIYSSTGQGTATLDASASTDPDGHLVRYVWKKISGPNGGWISDAFGPNSSTTVTGLIAGTYKYQLAVVDDRAAFTLDTVTLIVEQTPNKPPVVTVTLEDTVKLSFRNKGLLIGTASKDPDGWISAFKWTKVSGPAGSSFENADAGTTFATNLVEGVYVFRITVTDNEGLSASKDVVMHVVDDTKPQPPVNLAPVALAGSNLNIQLPQSTVTLDGSGSTDGDGHIAAFAWTYISDPNGSVLSDANAAIATVSELKEGIYSFKLTVTDNNGATASDTVQIQVQAALPPPNKIPKANAGPDIIITLPLHTATLDGSASTDEDGTIMSYSWAYVDGPDTYNIDNPKSEVTTVHGLKEGTYRFRLYIKDNDGGAASDIVIITVLPAPPPPNKAPVAEAGSDLTLTLPDNTATLDGTASVDEDGTIDSYLWTLASGPNTYSITDPSSVHTSVTSLEEGTYYFRLEVTDNEGASQADTMMIRVNAPVTPPPPPNAVPVANAGGDQSITLPSNTVALDGSASIDSDGTIASYSWIRIAGPTQYQLNNAESAIATATSLVEGTYHFQLQVKDNEGAIARDTVTITVYPAPNRPPVADAGYDIEVKLPVGAIKLNGNTSTDPDGSITQYSWSRISGPSQYTLADGNAAIATLTNVVAGVYAFQLEVRDDDGATAADTIRVIVEAANVPPTAKANGDLVITLPVDQVTLNGSASEDTDGSIVSYAWIKISGPDQYKIESPSSATSTVSQLTEGVYLFRLQVKDDENALGRDTVRVTVLPKPNDPPLADAGENIEVRLPHPEIRLNGLGSTDPDGTVEQYNWTKLEGPAGLTITNSNTARPSIVGVKEGTYRFQLTVTDNEGATASAEVTITVLPAISDVPVNKSPVAIAGNDQSVGLPVTTVTLNGVQSEDQDGIIAEYQWLQIAGPSEASLKTPGAPLTEATNLEAGEYQFELTVIDNNGAIGKDTVIVSVVSNLRFEEQVTVYPNPVHSSLNIQATTDMRGTGRISVFDVAGVRVHFSKTPINSTEWHSVVNVAQLKTGLYYLEVTVDGRHKLITRFFKK